MKKYNMNIQAHVIISGDVTGVGFRSWVLRQAQDKQLKGWVGNKDRGVVEAVFEGSKEKVEEIIARCRKGPEVAWVEKMEVKYEKATDEFLGFEIRY
ncbi:acylphosphatase [Candidatus Microgenomates bacterium]|nr:acylphosphatase [Candidatus Microgenomates bacterium]